MEASAKSPPPFLVQFLLTEALPKNKNKRPRSLQSPSTTRMFCIKVEHGVVLQIRPSLNPILAQGGPTPKGCGRSDLPPPKCSENLRQPKSPLTILPSRGPFPPNVWLWLSPALMGGLLCYSIARPPPPPVVYVSCPHSNSCSIFDCLFVQWVWTKMGHGRQPYVSPHPSEET